LCEDPKAAFLFAARSDGMVESKSRRAFL